MADEQLVLVLFAHGVGSAEANQQECTTTEGSVLVVGLVVIRYARESTKAVVTHFLLVTTITVEEAALSIGSNSQTKN